MNDGSANAKKSDARRLLAIVFFPIPFSILHCRTGVSRRLRILSRLWLGLYSVVLIALSLYGYHVYKTLEYKTSQYNVMLYP